MHYTSAAQYRAMRRHEIPSIERIDSDLWAIPVPMPAGQLDLQYNLGYVLRDAHGDLHVIDPGWDTSANRELWGRELERLGGTLRTVTATHHHPDHVGLAPWLREQTKARVRLHSLEVGAMREPRGPREEDLLLWKVPIDRHPEMLALRQFVSRPVEPDDLLSGTESSLEIPGRDVRALLTPGHTAGHISLRVVDASKLLTGDLVLPMIHAGIGLGGRTVGNPIEAYLTSLTTVSRLDSHEVLPGHGFRFSVLRSELEHPGIIISVARQRWLRSLSSMIDAASGTSRARSPGAGAGNA